MIPSRRSLGTLAVLSGAAGLTVAFPASQPAFAIVAATLALGALIDLLWVRWVPLLVVERQVARSLSLGAVSEVGLTLHNETRRSRRVIVHDHAPDALSARGLPRELRVPAGGFATFEYPIRALARGVHRFAAVEYRLASPLGLWWRARRGGEEQTVKVYPNFRAVARYALLARGNRLKEIGIHKRRRRGEGMEFHQLREYRVGDSLRQIDWRATSRLMKVVSREYREERDQQVVFMLDLGRRMHSRDGDLSHLDHALDAVLLLSYVALRQGDAVGLATFGGTERFIAPRKGPSFVNVLLGGVFDLQSSGCASDIVVAMQGTLSALTKRSLVVLVTNLRDDPDEEMLTVVRLAQRRHILLLASMREVALGEAIAAPPSHFDGALRSAATHLYLRHRAAAHRKLLRLGAHCLDVEPHALPRSLVNRYLDIKQSGAL